MKTKCQVNKGKPNFKTRKKGRKNELHKGKKSKDNKKKKREKFSKKSI